jgi:rare lipoprotein A
VKLKWLALLSMLLVASAALFGFDQSYNRVGYIQEGVASYYADQFHGRKTANGERFDMHDLTCAHPRIRFNTELRVTNLANGKSVIVRVNDRGPYVDNRIIDLSLAAARKLDMIRSGTSRVRCEVVSVEDMPPAVRERLERERRQREQGTEAEPTEQETAKKDKEKRPAWLDKLLGKKKKEEPAPQPKTDLPKRPKTKEPEPKETEPAKKPVPVDEPTVDTKPTPGGGGQVDMPNRRRNRPLTEDTFAGLNTYSLWGTIQYPEGFGVQVASYTVLDAALAKGREISGQGFDKVYIQTGWAGEKRAYRIIIGEGNEAQAASLIPDLKDSGYKGFVKQHY